MSYRTNPLIAAVGAPPIAAVHGWIAGREFSDSAPLLDVAQAVPGYPPPAALTDHLAGMVGRPETARYTAIEGLPSLRQALADDIARAYGGAVAAEQVCITAGCNQAFCLAMTALAGPAEEVILPVPYYFNHQMWLDMLGVHVEHLPFRPDRGGVPDPVQAAEHITPQTHAIVLVTPNNPTGAVYPPDVVEAFFELAKDAGIALVIDETYRDFLSAEGPPHRLFERPDWAGTLVHLYSFSKVFSLTGYRTGAVVADPALVAEVGKAMDCVAICAPRIGQDAALYGLANLDDWRGEKRQLMGDRVAALRQAFQRNDLAYELVSAGAYFAYLRHPFAGTPSAEVAKRLAQEHGVLCVPGGMFGPGQDDYLRFAFANLDAEFMPALAARLVDSQG